MRKVSAPAKKVKSRATTGRLANYKEFLWYKKHESELLERYFGRYLVIKNEAVVADYGTKTLAWQETIKTHKPGTFIIHHCVPIDPRKLPRLVNRQFVTVDG